ISPSSGSCEHTLNTLRYADRVKSLSKGSSSKKDVSSSTSNLRNSIALPVSSTTLTRFDDVIPEKPHETNRFGWRKQTDKDVSSLTMDHVPVGRSTTYTPPTENYISDNDGTDEEIMEDDFDHSMEVIEPKNISRFEKPDTQMKPIVEANDDLTVLLEEEENLVNAHRKQVEETMNIVREVASDAAAHVTK
ncbi:hypothetical protein M8C21_014732, partial [Ambrosia artemisiifolia]